MFQKHHQLDLEGVIAHLVIRRRPSFQMIDRTGYIGFQVGRGVALSCWTTQSLKPATALPLNRPLGR